jgi:hypothetical protein
MARPPPIPVCLRIHTPPPHGGWWSAQRIGRWDSRGFVLYDGRMNDAEFYSLVNAGPEEDEKGVLAYDVMMTVVEERDFAYETVKGGVRALIKSGDVEVVSSGVGRKRGWISAAHIRRTPQGTARMTIEIDRKVSDADSLRRLFEDRMSGRRAIRLRGLEIPNDVRWAVENEQASLVVRVEARG